MGFGDTLHRRDFVRAGLFFPLSAQDVVGSILIFDMDTMDGFNVQPFYLLYDCRMCDKTAFCNEKPQVGRLIGLVEGLW